ncbi:AzlC family ABC transporter permease [Knoellia sp. CPCC 206450]|uniref:AzlC family ABC transporter permease n=1 Tax=Knoellia tibetensis TaxID=3404798 RepID=UPI003B43BB5A
MSSATPASHDEGGHPAYAALTAGDRRAVLRQSLSVGIATGAYGISFGALGVASGLTTLQTVALSLLLFSGGSQFALVGILGAGGTGSAAVATSTLLGVRNGLYALQTSRILDLGGLRRLAAAQITIDESTAVAVGQEKRRAGRLGFWVTGITVFVFWNLMTFAGAVVGNALGDPQRWGLDAAAAAAFTALLWPRLHNRDAAATMVLAVAIALVASPLLPVGVPVILTVLAAVVVGLAAHGRHERTDPEVES